ncbi:hypothetical protein [Streptomyces sp. V4I2]|uniref:hypothetical protein n=1 Tax=Streptomyces sp. V4I2 TaxID=3042280 RepID=UPI0027844A34|nr:hypothetical protein [Streptomyces sp. V4I2]MDQ1044952.1 hypothetical protein [Streptomyces sp. V4I2]
MTMNPRLRKLTLTAHVTSSVGWLGAVAVFLVLAVAGLSSGSAQTVRGAYLAMEVTGWFVLVPLSFASLVTGLVQSLGSAWGLFRHYWVLFKLLINVVASVLLLVHMQVIDHVADAAAEANLSGDDLFGMRVQLLADAAAALLILLVAVTLSVFKPKGLTRYGWRRRQDSPAHQNSPTSMDLTRREARAR